MLLPVSDSSTACVQHHRFLSDSKDKEPEVLFVGDFLVQLMHQFGVRNYPLRPLFSPKCTLMSKLDLFFSRGNVGTFAGVAATLLHLKD